ncbi:hypothetical protein BDY24DRAFT_398010 [Mrakia frigida]|uniref:uncharacterized protein n=1 Tax=Mrakia frigida TaxID=29902 RepID=UPI003FCC0DDD
MASNNEHPEDPTATKAALSQLMSFDPVSRAMGVGLYDRKLQKVALKETGSDLGCCVSDNPLPFSCKKLGGGLATYFYLETFFLYVLYHEKAGKHWVEKLVTVHLPCIKDDSFLRFFIAQNLYAESVFSFEHLPGSYKKAFKLYVEGVKAGNWTWDVDKCLSKYQAALDLLCYDPQFDDVEYETYVVPSTATDFQKFWAYWKDQVRTELLHGLLGIGRGLPPPALFSDSTRSTSFPLARSSFSSLPSCTSPSSRVRRKTSEELLSPISSPSSSRTLNEKSPRRLDTRSVSKRINRLFSLLSHLKDEPSFDFLLTSYSLSLFMSPHVAYYVPVPARCPFSFQPFASLASVPFF